MSARVGTVVLDNQCRFNPAENIKMAIFFAVCVDLFVPGFGTTYIAVFDDNEGAKNLA